MQRVIFSTLVCLLLSSLTSQAVSSNDVSFRKRWVQSVSANVVIANLNCPNVKVSPALAQRGVGTSEGFGSMLSRLQPAAAITGTYFCVNSLIPVGDLVIDSNVLGFGSVGTAICFTADNQVHFKRTKDGQAEKWAGYVSVVCGGPRLVRSGIAAVYPHVEGFRDPSLFRPAVRSAIGVTRANKLLLVTVHKPIYLSHMARVMRDLGCVDAINLDGGSSTALYCKGVTPSHPARRLTNLIVIYESIEKYDKRRSTFGPKAVSTSRPSGQSGERDEESPGLSTSESEPMTEQESTRSAEPGASELDTEGMTDTTTEEGDVQITSIDPPLLVPQSNSEPANKEAAACECGLLPRMIDYPGLSRRTSSAWPRRTSSSCSHDKTSQPC